MDVIIIYLFIIGLFFGSFYNVVAERLSNNKSIIIPGSHCENCNHRLAWYELIPVFSFIFLGGKCRKCKTHISIQYPLMEILTGCFFALSYYIFGLSYETLISLVVVSVVIITFASDCKYMIILDEVIIIGTVLICLIYLFAYGHELILKSLLRGLILFVIFLAIKLIGDKAFKQESLGWGDVKLSFFSGVVLGIKLGVIYIFVAAFLALPYAIFVSITKKNSVIPFGPFLVISLLLIYWNSDFVITLVNYLFRV